MQEVPTKSGENLDLVMAPAEVSRALKCGINQVYESLRRGEIPNRKIGRRYIISRRRFYQWLDGDD